MMERGERHIVNIASLSGFDTLPLHIAYAAIKFGVVGFSEVLWAKARNRGVGVTVVCPGAVSTQIGFRSRNYYRNEKQWEHEERYGPCCKRRGWIPRKRGGKYW